MDCVARVKEYVEEQGLKIPRSRIEEMAQMLRTAGGDAYSRAEFHSKLQDMVDTDLAQFHAKAQAVRAMSLAAREQAVRQIENKEFGGSTFDNLRSWVDGSSLRKGDSVNLDPRRMASAVQGRLAAIWARGIEQYKVEAASGLLDREILQELDALQRGLPVGKSGSEAALQIARAGYALENEIVTRKKAVNPFFESAEGYLMKQSHDRVKVSSVDQAEWVADAMKAFGEKSFPELNQEQKVQAFADIYNRIQSGTWGTVYDDLNPNNFRQVGGPGGDILRRMTRQRQLISSGPDAFFEYNQKYGYGTVDDTMKQVMRRASKDIAVLDKFGPNPQEMYDGVVSRTRSRASADDQLAIDSGKSTLDAAFKNAVGLMDAPARTIWGKRLQALQALEYLSKGGGGVLRALPDVNIAASRMRDLNGRNLFQNAAEIIGEVAKNMAPGADRTGALQDIGMVAHSTVGDIMSNLMGGGVEGVPGKISALADAYGSITLHKQWIDSMRGAVGQLISRQLARLNETGWGDLPSEWQDGFKRYGLGEHSWEALRQSEIHDKLLTPEAVESLPDAAVTHFMRNTGALEADAAAPSKRVLDYERYKLAQKLGTLINDHADYGTINPNTRQRAFMNRGLGPDDPFGMALRLFTQFKTAALVTTDSYRRSWLSGQTLQGKLSGLTSTAVLGAFMYTVGEWALQLAAGKTPESPADPEMAMKILAGSGAGGIFADVLDQAAQQNGVKDARGAILASLAGPAVSSLAQGAAAGVKGVKDIAEGKPLPGADIGKMVLGEIPAQNLFWTKAVTNFYFANGLKEFLGPGYLNNLENKTGQKPGLLEDRQRYMYLRPTDSPRWMQ